MILKFEGNGKVLLEYLRTIPDIVEEIGNELVQIDFGELPKKCVGLREHLDTIVTSYRASHNLHQVYNVTIPEVKFYISDTELTYVKIIKVRQNNDKLIAYLDLLAKIDENSKDADVFVYLAYIKDNNVVKTFVDYLEHHKPSGVTIEWAVPPDTIDIKA